MIAIASSANVPAAVQSPRSIAAMPRSARRTGTNGRTPAWVASSTARTKSESACSGSPSIKYDTPSAWSIVARYGLAALSPCQRELGVAPHLGEPVAAQEDAQVGERGLGRVPIGERPCDWRSFCRDRPALRVTGSAGEGEHQRPVHGDRREVLDLAVGLEPLHPAQDGVGTATRPDRVGQLEDEAGDSFGIARGLGVLDRGLRHAVVLVPLGGPQVELGDHTGLTPPQLRQHQVPEKVVVAVPLAVPVEWDHEQVAALEPVEDVARARVVERRVAQRTAHVLEDRGVRQEVDLRVRQPVEELRTQVVGHEPVIAGERHAHLGGRPPRLDGECGEVDADGPSLGSSNEFVPICLGKVDVGTRAAATSPPRRPWPGRRPRSPRCRPAPAAAPPGAAARPASRSPAATPAACRGRARRWRRSTRGS